MTRSPTRTGMSPTTPAAGATHAVIAELDALLADLLIDGRQLRLARSQRRRRLVVFLLADGAGVEQRRAAAAVCCFQ